MKPLSPEVQQIQDKSATEKAIKSKWDALAKPTNPSVKQLQARVEILEEMLALKA